MYRYPPYTIVYIRVESRATSEPPCPGWIEHYFGYGYYSLTLLAELIHRVLAEWL